MDHKVEHVYGDHQPYFNRLRKRLFIGITIAFLVPLVLLSLYFHFQFDVTMKRTGKQHLRLLAESQRNTIDLFLQERVVNIFSLFHHRELVYTAACALIYVNPQPWTVSGILLVNALGTPVAGAVVIHVTSNHVIPLSLNVSLACDYRIAAENTVYENTYLDMGVVPIGGGPFFLSRLLGQGRAYELLLLTRRYSAYEALSWGIVDRVVPVADLETESLATAHRFGEVPATTLRGIKRNIWFSDEGLGRYLEFEQRELFRIIFHSEFRKQQIDSCRSPDT